MLTVGDIFPEFTRSGVEGNETRTFNSDCLTGKWTFLFFYPEDFSFICPTEANAFEQEKANIEAQGGQIIGVSVDEIDTHKAWIKELHLSYPLISDNEGELSKKVGVLDSDGRAKRALFILSPEKKIEFLMVTNRNVGRSVNEALRIFNAIKSGRLCPADFGSNGK